jgi:hypothetical protein
LNLNRNLEVPLIHVKDFIVLTLRLFLFLRRRLVAFGLAVDLPGSREVSQEGTIHFRLYLEGKLEVPPRHRSFRVWVLLFQTLAEGDAEQRTQPGLLALWRFSGWLFSTCLVDFPDAAGCHPRQQQNRKPVPRSQHGSPSPFHESGICTLSQIAETDLAAKRD